MTVERRREGGDLSDGEILTRLDTISGEVHAIRDDMATWRSEYVARAVYEADERTRTVIREGLEARDDEQGGLIADLQAEATRRARERRSLWAGISVAIVGALVAGAFTILGLHHQTSLTVCVPTTVVACQ